MRDLNVNEIKDVNGGYPNTLWINVVVMELYKRATSP